MNDIFELERQTAISTNSSYILSYPHILNYFAVKTTFGIEDVVCGAHMIYGWMPTVLDLYPHKKIDLKQAAKFLNDAKSNGALTDQEINDLAGLINNSLVGASKLLHFVIPLK